MNSHAPHPDSETLLRWIDEDLGARELETVVRHVSECEQCRNQSAVLHDTLAEYAQFHASVLKASMPPPPRPWDPIESRLAEYDRSRKAGARRAFHLRLRPWLAAAAALIAALLVIGRLTHAPEANAAELLDKAAQAERSEPVENRRIQIRTQNAVWSRARRVDATDSQRGDEGLAAIRNLFDAGGYSWADPLSAASYSRWRARLTQKRDEVIGVPNAKAAERWVINTTTTDGIIFEASLTLRATDLHAIACTLRFRSDQTVEISEAPNENGGPVRAPEVAPPAPSAAPPVARPAVQPAGPGEELQVIAALHAIGADLGEPVEVKRDGGAVIVTSTGMSESRERQVQDAISGIPGVQFKVESVRRQTPAGDLPAPARSFAPEGANPLITELQTRLGDGVSTPGLRDELIDYADRAIARAYAIRALARRFPSDAEGALTAGEQRVLHNIVQDHVNALANSMSALRGMLAPIVPEPETPPSEESTPADWRAQAERMVTSVQELDQVLNGSDAGMDAGARKSRLRELLAAIDGELRAVRAGIGQ